MKCRVCPNGDGTGVVRCVLVNRSEIDLCRTCQGRHASLIVAHGYTRFAPLSTSDNQAVSATINAIVRGEGPA